MTFKVCNHGSKYPYFNRAYVVRGYWFSATTVFSSFQIIFQGIGTRPDVEVDDVELGVSETAYEALDFLTAREKFWKQIQVGESGPKNAKNNKSNNRQHQKRRKSIAPDRKSSTLC